MSPGSLLGHDDGWEWKRFSFHFQFCACGFVIVIFLPTTKMYARFERKNHYGAHATLLRKNEYVCTMQYVVPTNIARNV